MGPAPTCTGRGWKGARHPLLPFHFFRYVRPGGGFAPNFQLFQKGDVNGEKEQKVYTFLKVRAHPPLTSKRARLGGTVVTPVPPSPCRTPALPWWKTLETPRSFSGSP